MSDASLSARPRVQASDSSARPQRPPRRISRVYSEMDDLEDADQSQASTSSIIRHEEVGRAGQSRIERLVKESATSEHDVDRTPTRNARTERILAERASRTALRKDLLEEVDETKKRQYPRTSGAGTNSYEEESIRSSVPALKHHAPTATIRSSEKNFENGHTASSSTIKSKAEEQLSPRSERLKRSQKYEEDIQRMRSESRLGDADAQREIRERRSFSRSSQKATDNTDTSGTEGSGPVIGNRRRKKSSTGSSSKKAAARAAQARDFYSSPSRRYSPHKDRVPSSSDGPASSSNGPYATLTSPLRTESAIDFASPNRTTSSRRMPLPSEFQSPRYRSEAIGDTSFERERQRRNSIDAAAQHRVWSRSDSISRGSQMERREERLQRLTALSPNSDAAIEILKSPIGTTSTTLEDRRMPNGESRTLSRQSSRIGKYGALTERNALDSQGDRSISDLLRQRKISNSSSVSLRSSSGTSEMHRASSRSSLRRNQGRGVFDDGSAPPVPDLSKHPLSPLYHTFDLPQEQRSQIASERQPTIKGEHWRKEVEDLQSRIDQLTVAATNPTSRRENHSRSSSRASASAPRSSTSNISSTQSTSINRKPNRPSTKPQKVLNGNDRTRAGPPPPLPGQRYESLSRASVREAERRMPVTPIMTDMRAFSGSRMGSGAQSSIGRFSSMGRDASRSLLASTGSGPLHERNLLHSVDAFERHLLDIRLHSDGSLSSPYTNAQTETNELVTKFRETSEATIKINTGLRQLLQSILECQIDAEVQGEEKDSVTLLHDIDKSLSLILRDSDEQMRSLTDGLLAFTRAEKERDRLRRTTSDLNRSTSTLPRSSSRLASLGLLHMSPERERKIGRDTSTALYNDRRPSTDLRKSITLRDRDRERIVASNSNSSIQAIESRSQASDHSSGSRNSADSSHHHARRHTLLHASRESSSMGSSKSPSVPYSPSPNPSAIISGAGIHPRIRGSNTSPTLDMHINRRASVMDRDVNHSRSASEVNLKTHTSHLTGLESLIQRSPLLRRDKSSTTSVQTIRGPISLSPKRAQLSFPIVSAMTVEASTANDSMMDHGEGYRTSPIPSNDYDNDEGSPEGSVD